MYGISIGCAWQDMFLGWRTTLVLDLNPCFAMRDDPRTSDQVMSNLTRAAFIPWDALMEHDKYYGAFREQDVLIGTYPNYNPILSLTLSLPGRYGCSLDIAI